MVLRQCLKCNNWDERLYKRMKYIPPTFYKHKQAIACVLKNSTNKYTNLFFLYATFPLVSKYVVPRREIYFNWNAKFCNKGTSYTAAHHTSLIPYRLSFQYKYLQLSRQTTMALQWQSPQKSNKYNSKIHTNTYLLMLFVAQKVILIYKWFKIIFNDEE